MILFYLFMLNPLDAECNFAQDTRMQNKHVRKLPKPCFVGIHQTTPVNTHMPGFQLSSIFASFCLDQISPQHHNDYKVLLKLLPALMISLPLTKEFNVHVP